MGCHGQLAFVTDLPGRVFFTRKCTGVGVRIPMQDYKSLRSAVMFCAILVNTQTHTETGFDPLYYKLSQLS